MNEITHIHLGRQPFTIAVDAHRVLRAYLAAIEHHSGKHADVMEEVELRMAELLTERGITGEKVVLLDDVEYLKQQLGEPSEFTEDEKEGKPHDEVEQGGRRLFRDTEHGMIAGVASGLAAYFGIDPLIVRLIFVLLLFSGGAGILVYVLLWLLVPPARSGSDRLQMSGKAVTVENIKDAIAQADVAGTAHRTTHTVALAGGILGKIILGVVGVCLITWGVCVLLADATVLTFGLAHGLQLGGKDIFPVGTREQAAVVGGFVTVLVIGLLGILGGRAMIRRKWGVPGWALAALAALFIAGGAVGTAASLAAVPDVRNRYQSVTHSEWRSMPAFTTAHMNMNNVNFGFVSDNHYGVEIRTIGNVDTHGISAKVVKGQLYVDTDGFHPGGSNCFFVCPYGPSNTELIVHAPSTFSGDVQDFDSGGFKLDVPRYQDAPALPASPVDLRNN
ncbi:MAG TPA: PspC domain-containing protein [Candidatus Saccharimonadales bacterium]